MDSEKDPNNPNVPDNPIEEIVRSLHFREDNRRRAIDLAWHQFDMAETEADRHLALVNVVRMMGVLEEFHGQFPEVFPSDDENSQ